MWSCAATKRPVFRHCDARCITILGQVDGWSVVLNPPFFLTNSPSVAVAVRARLAGLLRLPSRSWIGADVLNDSDQGAGDRDDGTDSPRVAASPDSGAARPSNVILVGMMGAGKSTIGWMLARLAGLGFLDGDREVERRAGKSVARIFADDGEPRFRGLERKVIREWLGIRNHVLAVGGGAVADDESWSVLRSLGTLVWLNPPLEIVARRMLNNPQLLAQRPLIADLAKVSDDPVVRATESASRFQYLVDRLANLSRDRAARYGEAPVRFDSGHETPETSAKVLLAQLEEIGVLNVERRFRLMKPWPNS